MVIDMQLTNKTYLLHVVPYKGIQDSGFHTTDSGIHVLDSSPSQWNLDFGFQSLVGFRNL